MKNRVSEKKAVPVPGRGGGFCRGASLRWKKTVCIAVCMMLGAGTFIAEASLAPEKESSYVSQTTDRHDMLSKSASAVGEEPVLAGFESAALPESEKTTKKISDKAIRGYDAQEKARFDIEETELEYGDDLAEVLTANEAEGVSGGVDSIDGLDGIDGGDDVGGVDGEEKAVRGESPSVDGAHMDEDVYGGAEEPEEPALHTPVEGFTVSSPFGPRWGSLHTGIDLALAQGNPICAADGGTVYFSGYGGGYGNIVKIDHGNGMQTYYAHCSQLLVSEGQQVERGERIALVGSTGNSTGPHVHFEVIIDGNCVDPAEHLDLETDRNSE